MNAGKKTSLNALYIPRLRVPTQFEVVQVVMNVAVKKSLRTKKHLIEMAHEIPLRMRERERKSAS